jgi:hypothetical protein
MFRFDSVRQIPFAASAFLRRHRELSILALISVVTISVYFPALNAYFISDDFAYISYLLVNVKSLLRWDSLEFWFVGGIDGYLYLRPWGHAMTLIDFLAWNIAPLGYHLTNVAFHILTTFELYLVGRLLSRQQLVGIIAGLLFAVMPLHSGAVGWIAARYDVLAGLACLTSLTFFVLYRRTNNLRLYMFSIGAFMFALVSKETALAFPLGVLLYDWLFNPDLARDPRELLKHHLPFWLITGARLLLWGRGYQTFRFDLDTWFHWLDGNLLNVIDPLAQDLSTEIRWALIASFILVLWIYRSRPQVTFGLLWIPLMSVTTIFSGVSDRSFYIPSLGLALALAAILNPLIAQERLLPRVAGIICVCSLVAVYASSLYSRAQDIYRAGEIAQAIPAQVEALHPTITKGARLVFVGVPDRTPEGTLVYITGFPGFLPIFYADSSPQIFRMSKFPIWFDEPDRMYFFQVDHRQVRERADLVQMLKELGQCGVSTRPAVEWNFDRDVQGWEPWNDLTAFQIVDGALVTRSEGSDPYMGGPPINVPAIEIGTIDVTIRIRAASPTVDASIYWLASGQNDFSPYLQESFAIQADGEFHTYRVNIGNSGKLLIDDRINQLRLDPATIPAEIAIKSIAIYGRCHNQADGRCSCSP